MEAAFFDLDKTVIARASMIAFGKPLRDAGFISRRMLLRALYGQLVYLYLGADEDKMEEMRASALKLTAGWDQARVSQIVQESLDAIIEPIVYEEALELIGAHQSSGRMVYIVSASPEEIVLPLVRYLGVDGAIATRARIDADGRYTGETEFYAYGPNKAVAIRELAERLDIDLAASYAYSDSATDLPMLQVVGRPVAVNPDRELLRAAREHEWEVRNFVRAVRLRDRVPARAPWVAAGVLATAGAASGAAWWVLRARGGPVAETTGEPGWVKALGAVRRLSREPSSPRRQREH